MKQVCILYFSGTGMTKHLVDCLQSAFADAGVGTTSLPLEREDPRHLGLFSFDAVVLAFPVHAFNAPQLVVRFARQLPLAQRFKAFVVCTAGENSPINSAASGTLRRVLRQRGYRVLYDALVPLPSNFGVRHSDEEARRLLEEANDRAQDIVQAVTTGRGALQHPGPAARAAAALGKAEWPGAHLAGQLFFAGDGCTRCGRCAARCPTHNITQGAEGITFGRQCCLCLRCVYGCPVDAINLRQPFGAIRVQPWYQGIPPPL